MTLETGFLKFIKINKVLYKDFKSLLNNKKVMINRTNNLYRYNFTCKSIVKALKGISV